MSEQSVRAEKPIEITNWTRFPNSILDNLDKLTHIEFKILGLMVRKNIGYQHPNKQFSVRYISSKIKSNLKSVNSGLKSLVEKKTIIQIGTGKKGVRYYDIQWAEHDTDVKMRINDLNRCKNAYLSKDSGKSINGNRSKSINEYKKTILKENTTTSSPFIYDFFPKYVTLTPKRIIQLESLKQQYGLQYLKDHAEYTQKRCKTNFWGYFIKSCKEGWDVADESDGVAATRVKHPEHLKDGTVVVYAGKEYTIEAGGFMVTDKGTYTPGQIASAVENGIVKIKTQKK